VLRSAVRLGFERNWCGATAERPMSDGLKDRVRALYAAVNTGDVASG
jgi:hypothetical protein